jgi:hypothetical protein
MKSRHVGFLASALVLGLIACGGSLHDQANQLATEQAGVRMEMTGVVNGISNGENLEDAKSELQVLGRKLIEIRMEWVQLSKEGLSSEETAAILKTHLKLNAAQKEYHEAVNRLASNPSMVEYVNEVMQDAGDNAGQ